MDDARLRFLFGFVPEPDSYDEDGRSALIAEDRDGDHSALRTVIANQILDDDPPFVWRTATRLLAAGLSRHDAMDQLVNALRPLIAEMVNAATPYDPEDYAAALDSLPLPTVDEAVAQYLDVARAARVIQADELEHLVAERFGLSAEDPLVESLLDDVDSELYEDPSSPVTMLASDLVAHLPVLVDGGVLTHRLTAAEQADDRLDLQPDLAVLTWIDEPRAGDVVLDADADHWQGPSGWLADLPVGGLLAVRASEDGAVTVEPLPTPPAPSPELVEELRAAYEAELDGPALPVDGRDLVAAMLHRDPAAFAEPRPPLSELAAAAGLQERDGEFAHDASVWDHALDVGRLSRLMARLGPGAGAAAEAYALLTEDADDPSALRVALDILDDPEVLTAVVDELLGPDDDPERVRDLVALAERLVRVGGGAERGAVAAVVAAYAAERDGRAPDAESHLRTAARLAEGWDYVEDRLGWYESDRGNANAALARWTGIGVSTAHPDVIAVRPFVATAARRPGRNEPCWCGSGRKYKQCHRDQVERAPLHERTHWLWHKAEAYLTRHGGLVPALAPYLLARFPDLGDAGIDPFVLDVALVEGGLFARFLADRGPLLPEDERRLAEAWMHVERTVYEITAVEPGKGTSLRDLRTGERLLVRSRNRDAAPGHLVCARAVPDGKGLQFVGAPYGVAPGTERHVMALLDKRDGLGLLEWVARQEDARQNGRVQPDFTSERVRSGGGPQPT